LENREKLVEVGKLCLSGNDVQNAILAFQAAGEPEKLNDVGDLCLKNGSIKTALEVYQLAGNQMMSQFIQQNFVK
ncbi:MAG TPA: hypothetical protein VJB12_04605, partial [Candidatus Nanoarchaeia archaeon]|nr:hypothetical protein [Candidatus Nanoarchaeia archaeon]